ncbi:MAG: hypothetical protein JWM34_4786 [Ilumatobacteraceae bacterium]|nr:hypothetical protein [Ilumatobacteraceae bacterium]
MSGAVRSRLRTLTAAEYASAWERRHWTSRVLHRIGAIAAQAELGVASAVLAIVWLVVGVVDRFPRWWQTTLYSVTGSVTFVMVFVILHTQDRQTAATQRKLDELIRASAQADNQLIAVEQTNDEQLDELSRNSVADRVNAAGEKGQPEG